MGVIAGRGRGARSMAGLLLAGTVAVGGCASETEVPLFRGEAPPMPADVDAAVADALAASEEVESAAVVARISFGPGASEITGEWTRSGLGTGTVEVRGPGRVPVEAEVRSDGETAWVRSDDDAFADALPAGTEWLEASRAELVEAGVLTDFTNPWDPLLFARDLDEVTDGGIGSVNGDLVRLVRGEVDYEAAFDRATADERARMEHTFSWPGSVRAFTAEIALDGEGRARRIDYEVRLGVGDSPDLPVGLHVEVLRVDHAVEPPTPPDPEDTASVSTSPGALDALRALLGVDRGSPPPDDGVSEDDDVGAASVDDEPAAVDDPADDPAGVLDREAPEPEPPPADTPADAVDTTTLIEGEGPPAEAGDTVHVHYVLVLADGQVPDSSWESGGPFPFTIGDGTVIAGWDEGMVGARAGERRRLVIGADKAYGSQGSGDIPPGAPLAFEIDVVRIEPG